MNIKVVLIVLLITLIFLVGCTEPVEEVVNEEADLVREDLSIANNKIIVLQDDLRYVRTEMEVARDEKEELQEIYNSITIDWQNCYMADFCLYYPKDCVVWAEENYDFLEQYTANDLHVFFSDECEKSDRDWDKYISFYTGD